MIYLWLKSAKPALRHLSWTLEFNPKYKKLYKKQNKCQHNTSQGKIHTLFKYGCCGSEHPKGRYRKEQKRNPEENTQPKQGMPRMHFMEGNSFFIFPEIDPAILCSRLSQKIQSLVLETKFYNCAISRLMVMSTSTPKVGVSPPAPNSNRFTVPVSFNHSFNFLLGASVIMPLSFPL
ncbi:hypothetical protein SAMN05421636_103472 [Pricia antarctica]|uniref:Uncharacterized protein n=1 Tax=Pricia antarctica TaxID=641691 RepID=A0A1G7ARB6_9FLAO|nr:hypothetical protein [Pricia antarctica]SDE16545.1 hypothetical protein SAMN05421636_103472 [Pricia antarctica]